MSKNQFRKKREDTKIRTVEKQYGVDFNVRSDMKLGTYLKKEGYSSLSAAVRKLEKKK